MRDSKRNRCESSPSVGLLWVSIYVYPRIYFEKEIYAHLLIFCGSVGVTTTIGRGFGRMANQCSPGIMAKTRTAAPTFHSEGVASLDTLASIMNTVAHHQGSFV